VKKRIEICKGLIVLGLERSHAYLVRDREGSMEPKDRTHRRYASGWLHLEAGIAHSLDLPIFVMCERGIASDGIFDREWNSYAVMEFDVLTGC
jgi:hypothetical protein